MRSQMITRARVLFFARSGRGRGIHVHLRANLRPGMHGRLTGLEPPGAGEDSRCCCPSRPLCLSSKAFRTNGKDTSMVCNQARRGHSGPCIDPPCAGTARH
jgi:hypothetical protein